jgi:hypothetical protein
MKPLFLSLTAPLAFSPLLLLLPSAVLAADPRTNSWDAVASSHYARIYQTPAEQSSGTAKATWSNGSQTQTLPAYAGVQEVSVSADWVYVRTTGLGGHVMGPWLNGNFPNLPTNRKTLYRIPRTPAVPSTPALTGLGSVGIFVDGVAMFDSRDAFSWNGTAEGNGTGFWNREAYVNEGATFDPAFAHQENTGTYHYHASPIALRHRLGDHVDFDATTRTYRESSAPVTRHSPILGWVQDGFPIYGPYGYSNATNATSGLRRMLSGYQLRNGQRGTDNLTTAGRTAIPSWARRLYGTTGNQTGPAVSTQYPLGRYMEDNAFLGDLVDPSTGQQFVAGVDYDLDEDNGRWCVTPEFPDGTYAYFVSIAADGTPVFPYNIGRAFHGTPAGGAVTAINETVTTRVVGGPEQPVALSKPAVTGGSVTLVWNAAEGGSYQVESSTNLSNWSTNATGVLAAEGRLSQTVAGEAAQSLYRIRRTALATYDPATGTATGGGGGNNGGGGANPPLTSVAPSMGDRGTTVTLTLTLGGMAPPANMVPTAVRVGTLSGTNLRRASNTTVTATLVIPATATPGALDVAVEFPGPPNMGTVSFTLAGGFTVR